MTIAELSTDSGYQESVVAAALGAWMHSGSRRATGFAPHAGAYEEPADRHAASRT